MSDIRIVTNQSPVISAENGFRSPWGSLLGSLGTIPEASLLVRAGYGFHVTVGALSTPITGGGAGTILDLDQPEAIISVPDGAAIMPIRVHVQGHVGLMATDADEYEILIAVDRAAAAVDDGTKTAETIFNMRTDNPISSVCTATSAYTADVTDPVLGIELARKVITGDVQTAVGTTWGELDLLYEPQHPPVIVGPAMLIVYWGGTVALPGFAQIQWVEFPSSIAQAVI